jgi:hypothetical protein
MHITVLTLTIKLPNLEFGNLFFRYSSSITSHVAMDVKLSRPINSCMGVQVWHAL